MGAPRTQHRAGNGRQPPESSPRSSWQPFRKPSRGIFTGIIWLLTNLDRHFAIRSSFSSLVLLLREDLQKNCHSESRAQSSLPSSWQWHEHHRHNYYVSRKLTTVTHTNVFDLLGHRPVRQWELLDLDIQHNPITCAYFFPSWFIISTPHCHYSIHDSIPLLYSYDHRWDKGSWDAPPCIASSITRRHLSGTDRKMRNKKKCL